MKLTRKLLLCLTLGLALAFTAGGAWAALEDADTIFITVDNSYTACALGSIEVTSPDAISQDLKSFTNGDVMGMVLEAGGQKKILVREYNGGSAPDTVSLYPGENWSGPIANTTLGDNIYQADVSDNYLYIGNYGDTGNRSGSVQQFELQDLLDSESMEAVKTITFDDNDAFTDQTKDFRIIGNYLYAVVQDINESFEHDAGTLFEISIPDMEVVDSMDIGKNPGGASRKAAMAQYGNDLYIACMGGGFGGTLNPELIKVNLTTFEKTIIDDGTALPDTYGYCGIAIADDGTVLINAGSTDWMAATKLYQTTVSELETSTMTPTALPGTFWDDKEVDLSSVYMGMGIGFGGTLFYDASTERFWIEGSYAIVTVDKSGNLIRTYDAMELNGNPYDILPADGLSFAGEILLGSSGSGGCNVSGFAPAALLLLAPLFSILRKK